MRALRLDVSDDASVRAAAETFGEAGDRLNVLINDAGTAIGDASRIGVCYVDDGKRRLSQEMANRLSSSGFSSGR